MFNPNRRLRSLRGACIVGALCLPVLSLVSQSAFGQFPTRIAIPVKLDTTLYGASDVAVELDSIAEVYTVDGSLVKPRLKQIEKTIPLTYNDIIHKYIDIFTYRKPHYTKRMLERMAVYFPLYEKYLAKYDLPDELKYLSIVESALNPRAVSHAGAGGLWQFMPATGRELRLSQDEYVDERMDPEKSTEAACRHLKGLYRMFGDWHLVMAAYNSGAGTVKRAMSRTGGRSFWDIYNALPKETQGYVPIYIATTYMMHYAHEHGLFAERPDHPVPFDTIQVNSYFCLQTFAKECGMPLVELQRLNPAITTVNLPEFARNVVVRLPSSYYYTFQQNRSAILDSATRMPVETEHMLLAEAEDPDRASEAYAAHWFAYARNVDDNAAIIPDAVPVDELLAEEDEKPAVKAEKVTVWKTKKQTHIVRKGETLSRIANRYDVSVSDLKRWNRLRSASVRKGQGLVIIREIKVTETRLVQVEEKATAPKPVVEKVEKSKVAKSITKKIKPKYHQVQAGDTLWSIAERYDRSVERLKKLNHIRGNKLRRGQRLIIG
ncbi:hypothetical protein GCM10023189_16200 [Nibrella saemangeumensis]|uniref:LysM domain-containing protein n=1 Tax=Nibrella saemangeumensis TaxID=1084526 RepID=A0ABP8MPN5_9BACT